VMKQGIGPVEGKGAQTKLEQTERGGCKEK
jgi:hypothetical protein